MHRRQVLFSQAGEGVDNIKDYMATNPPEPMPRILLVIDESHNFRNTGTLRYDSTVSDLGHFRTWGKYLKTARLSA